MTPYTLASRLASEDIGIAIARSGGPSGGWSILWCGRTLYQYGSSVAEWDRMCWACAAICGWPTLALDDTTTIDMTERTRAAPTLTATETSPQP